jgi:hypothetical protein
VNLDGAGVWGDLRGELCTLYLREYEMNRPLLVQTRLVQTRRETLEALEAMVCFLR